MDHRNTLGTSHAKYDDMFKKRDLYKMHPETLVSEINKDPTNKEKLTMKDLLEKGHAYIANNKKSAIMPIYGETRVTAVEASGEAAEEHLGKIEMALARLEEAILSQKEAE